MLGFGSKPLERSDLRLARGAEVGQAFDFELPSWSRLIFLGPSPGTVEQGHEGQEVWPVAGRLRRGVAPWCASWTIFENIVEPMPGVSASGRRRSAREVGREDLSVWAAL